MPRTAGHDGEPFYPQLLERGRRSVHVVMPTLAEMYIDGFHNPRRRPSALGWESPVAFDRKGA
jgi:hypothetical protein